MGVAVFAVRQRGPLPKPPPSTSHHPFAYSLKQRHTMTCHVVTYSKWQGTLAEPKNLQACRYPSAAMLLS